MKHTLEKHYTGVITVPAYFNDCTEAGYKDAGAIAVGSNEDFNELCRALAWVLIKRLKTQDPYLRSWRWYHDVSILSLEVGYSRYFQQWRHSSGGDDLTEDSRLSC